MNLAKIKRRKEAELSTTVTLRVPVSFCEKLKNLAVVEDRSVSNFIIHYLKLYFKQNSINIDSQLPPAKAGGLQFQEKE